MDSEMTATTEVARPHLVQRLKNRLATRERYTGIDRDFSLDYMGATEFEDGSAFRSQWERAVQHAEGVCDFLRTQIEKAEQAAKERECPSTE